MTRDDLVKQLDEYVLNLRILSLRHVGADALKDKTSLLAPDWRTVNWYDSLWLFELEGIKASGYPDVLTGGTPAAYAEPAKFGRRASSIMFKAPDRNRTLWSIRWRRLSDLAIELDPRYVAFRTTHDWIVLCAHVLSSVMEDHSGTGWLPETRRDPFTQPIRTVDSDGESYGLLCGNLRERLMGGRSASRWDAGYAAPEWRDVEQPWEALYYFHWRGLMLPMELRYGALRGGADQRLVSLELLTPESFAAYVADVLVCEDRSLSRSWRERPVEDVRLDPRFIAHKCGFDSQMILHIARKATKAWVDPVPEPELELDLEITDHRSFEEVIRDIDAACEDLPDACSTTLDKRDDDESKRR